MDTDIVGFDDAMVRIHEMLDELKDIKRDLVLLNSQWEAFKEHLDDRGRPLVHGTDGNDSLKHHVFSDTVKSVGRRV